MKPLIFIVMILSVFVGLMIWVIYFDPQVQAVQKFRREWQSNCLNHGGYIITMSKSNVSHMCVARDGRILSSY